MADEVVFRPPSKSILSIAWHTPLSDVLRGRFTARLDPRRTIADFRLPDEAAALAYEVVRRTRLTRLEKVEVAREIGVHFADGLAAGAPLDRLIDEFGRPEVAAPLITRGKRRLRTPFARFRHLAKRAVLYTAGAAVAVYLLVLVRFWVARPTLSHDYWRDLNAVRRAPDGAQTAWPLYQRAAARLAQKDLSEEQFQAIARGPSGANWNAVVTLVGENQPAIDLARQAAAQPDLGFLLEPTDHAAAQGPNPALIGASLEYVNSFRELSKLLVADTYLAASEGDAARVMADTDALMAMAQHAWPERPTLVEQLVALAVARLAWDAIGRIIVEYPDLLSDAQLRDLAHRVAGQFGGGRLRAEMDFERTTILDVLQRTFTDDGRGGGLATAEGLWFLGAFGGEPRLIPLTSTILKDDEKFAFYAFGGPTCLAMGNRREQVRLMDEFFAAMQRDTAAPPWQWKGDPIEPFEARLKDGVYYRPLALLLPSLSMATQAIEKAMQRRDATLVALALAIYHRRHDAWPDSLAELTPGLLPEVPPDRCDGQPLRYLLRDGKPLLYSIGGNFRDDGGLPGDDLAASPRYFDREKILNAPPDAAQQGDWILWPPQDEQSAGAAGSTP